MADLILKTLLPALIAAGLASFVTHNLALGRDRRKEFNEVTLRLKMAFDEAAANDGRARFEREDWVMFLHLVGGRRRASCEKAMEQYEGENQRIWVDNSGIGHFEDPAAFHEATARVAAMFKLR